MSKSILGPAAQVLNLIDRAGVSKEQLQALIETGLLSDLLIAPNPKGVDRFKFAVACGLAAKSNFVLKVDLGVYGAYDTIGQVVDMGNYDFINSDLHITREDTNVPLRFRAQFFWYEDQVMNAGAVKENMGTAGYRPADQYELAAIGAALATHGFASTAYKHRHIVALGEPVGVEDGTGIPTIFQYPNERRLGVYDAGNGFDDRFLFAGVKVGY